jgi:RNA polymerase sigma factor (sigma-70 family)
VLFTFFCPFCRFGGVIEVMMQSPSDNLLAKYQETPSDEAFRALVSRHSSLVHTTATRLLNGDQSAADDVSQQVFLRLLKRANSLPPQACVAGWLYRQTCRLSSDFRRSTLRRKVREQIAHTNMTDHESAKFTAEIDEALAKLPEQDRNVILLRYFEERSHRAVGDSLGISEDAARKRCARAVEDLRSFFERNGQVFSAGSLGVLLTGLAGKPLNAAALEKIIPPSLGVTTATKASPVLSFTAGLALAGLLAGGFFMVSQKTLQQGVVEPVKVSQRSTRAERGSYTKGFKYQSITNVMDQVRFLARRPRNVMTTMKLEALFDSLPVDQRAAFFVEAKDILAIAEKRFSYSGFLRNWIKEAPEEAMNLCLMEDIQRQLSDSSTRLVQNLFSDWSRKDPSASSAWLRRNWSHPSLDASGLPHTLKVAMSHRFVRGTLDKEGVEAAFEVARTFGGSEDFELVSEVITGTLWHQIRDEQGPEIYRYLIELPESKERNEMIKKFIGNWKRFQADAAIKALEELQPSERLTLELTLLGEFVRETRKKELANGSFTFEAIGDGPTEENRALRRREREEGFRETARLAGLDEEQANLMIARYYLADEYEDASEILKLLTSSPELDQAIMETIRSVKDVVLRGSAKKELMAFRYVQHLTSDAEREQLSRALFRRVIVKNPHDARALLSNPDLSPAILEILNEVALQSSL